MFGLGQEIRSVMVMVIGGPGQILSLVPPIPNLIQGEGQGEGKNLGVGQDLLHGLGIGRDLCQNLGIDIMAIIDIDPQGLGLRTGNTDLGHLDLGQSTGIPGPDSIDTGLGLSLGQGTHKTLKFLTCRS